MLPIQTQFGEDFLIAIMGVMTLIKVVYSLLFKFKEDSDRQNENIPLYYLLSHAHKLCLQAYHFMFLLNKNKIFLLMMAHGCACAHNRVY